jgi:hypothetical protein
MTSRERTAGESAIAASRCMVVVTIGASLFSLLFILSYAYAIHDPRPHHVRIDVVAATTAAVDALRSDLNRTGPGGFDVRSSPNSQSARRDVLHASVNGALIVGPGTTDQILVASAAGVSLQQVIVNALSAERRARGRQVQIIDLVPLPPGDRAGQSSFVFEIGLLIPGVIGSVGFYLLGRRARLWVRVGAAAGYALLASTLGVVVLDAGLGALTGSPWTLIATGALVAAAFVLTVAALHALLGLPGTGVAAGALLVVGNAVNGSTVPILMLPTGYRQIAPWLPNAAAVHTFRSDVYFHGNGIGQPLLALGLWVGAALIILVIADIRHLRRRKLAPDHHEQIHSTSVLQQVHDRRLRSHQDAHSPESTEVITG